MSGFVFLYSLVLLVLLQCFSNVSAFNGRCASGWTFFEHSCYRLTISPTAKFPAAQVKCESFGASLVSISSAKENQFVADYIGRPSLDSSWTGLNDIQQEGIFQWMDGTHFRYSWDNDTDHDHEYSDSDSDSDSSYTPSSNQGYCHDAELDFSRWNRLEPNNRRGDEDCVYILRDSGYWFDAACRVPRSYTCEKVASEEGTLNETTITCPHSFETVIELGIAQKKVNWSEPAYFADSLASHIERSHSPGAEFRIGVTWVNYTFKDQYNNTATCNFTITVLEVDTTPPTIVSCPSDVTVTKLSNVPLTVTWKPPGATDLSESVTLMSQSHFPGAEFAIGVNNVIYKFKDGSGNKAVCFFKINVFEVNNPMESLVNAKTYEAQDLVKNEIRGDINKGNGLVAGLYVILGFIGLTLILLFVVRFIRRKIDTDVGKQSYANMSGDAEMDVVTI